MDGWGGGTWKEQEKEVEQKEEEERGGGEGEEGQEEKESEKSEETRRLRVNAPYHHQRNPYWRAVCKDSTLASYLSRAKMACVWIKRCAS
jgi:hypothetical protein